jgi:hypothetical protein
VGALYQQNEYQYKDETISNESLTHSTHSLCTHTLSLQYFLAILTPLPRSFPFLLLSIVDGTSHTPSAENCEESGRGGGGLNGSNVSLERATDLSVLDTVNVAGQDILDSDQTPTNLTGEFKATCQV